MAQVTPLILAAIVVLILFQHGMSAAVGSAVRRDTDETAQLRAKLQKLHALLSDYYADEVQSKSEVKGPDANVKATENASQNESDDVKELDQLNTQQAASNKDKAEDQTSAKDKDEEESVQILARALSRLGQPEYDTRDSMGERMGTSFNEPQHGQEEDMEKVVERALERLQMDKERTGQGMNDAVPYGNFDEGEFDSLPSKGAYQKARLPPMAPPSEVRTYHSDAVKAVEINLMRDLQLAAKLGVSVDELIDDLDEKAYREAEIREVERKLAVLNRPRYSN